MPIGATEIIGKGKIALNFVYFNIFDGGSKFGPSTQLGLFQKTATAQQFSNLFDWHYIG